MFDPFLTLKQILRKLGGDVKKSTTAHSFELTISGEMSGFEGDYTLNLVEGNACTVTTDSGRYTAVVKRDESMDILYLGNLGLSGMGNDTGESFLVVDARMVCSIIDSACGTSCVVATATETIVPIDQKYLPGAVVDFDQLGLTAPVLQLLNSGGGRTEVMKDNNYGIDIEEVRQAFPKGRPFAAVLDVPGMGFMTVTPVYTLFASNGFTAAHFDSYMQNEAGLLKFYVRITTNYQAGTIAQVNIAVGFYQ